MFDDSVKAFSVRAVVSNRKDSTVDGYPSTELDTRMVVGSVLVYSHVKLVRAGTRSYIIQIATHHEAGLTKPDVKKFFSSFRIEK